MRGSAPRPPTNPLLANSAVSVSDSFGLSSPALAPPAAPPPANRFSMSGSAPRSRYVAPPSALGGIAPTSRHSPMGPPVMTSTPSLNMPSQSVFNCSPGPPPSHTPSTLLSHNDNLGVNKATLDMSEGSVAPVLSVGSALAEPMGNLNMSSGFEEVTDDVAKSLPPFSSAVSKSVPLVFHWFFKSRVSSMNLNPFAQASSETVSNEERNFYERWKPFSMIDSEALEMAFTSQVEDVVSTDGGRYDASLAKREKNSVYWNEEPMPIRRCSWFYRSNADGRWSPYEENTAAKLESLYQESLANNKWDKRLTLDNGDNVMLHSAHVMVHVPFGCSSASVMGHLDDWGQVQPQDAESKPRLVHRGLDGLPEIDEGEEEQIDHLVFVVHGIGAACDMRFRPINEVVDSFRELNADLSNRHFQSAHLASTIGRIEYLPVNWHENLHGEAAGTDKRLKPLTLKSVPKMRNFVNDTLLDILFYTSPKFCQQIVDTVVNEINRMHSVFLERNPGFRGQVTLVGHSLGSLILFDILSHQKCEEASNVKEPKVELRTANLKYGDERDFSEETNIPPSLETMFAELDLSEFAPIFISENIDLEALKTFTEQELVEAGLPWDAASKLFQFLQNQQNGNKYGIDANLVTSDVKYSLGPAGTGQPSVQYSQLKFEPYAFFSLGSPIAMFLSVRGIETLSSEYTLPTCKRFFNIFHPFDPVAYRVESLIDPHFAQMRPLTIPHHKGRKRMHLELKDTVTKIMTTDIKRKIVDTLSSVYNLALGNTKDEEKRVQEELEEEAKKNDKLDAANPSTIDARLNNGQRIDYVLQEAPLESFNEYLFALASHLCYWESEDTALMILREIYASMGVYTDEVKANLRADNPIKPPVQMPPQKPLSLTQTSVPSANPAPQMAPAAQLFNQSSPAAPSSFLPSTTSAPPPLPPSALGAPPTLPPSALGAPPTLPPSALAAAPSLPSTMSRPMPGSSVGLGMDPTMPVRRDGNIGPPPVGGFYTNKPKN